MLQGFDEAFHARYQSSADLTHHTSIARAMRLMNSKQKEAFDVSREPANIREMYGPPASASAPQAGGGKMTKMVSSGEKAGSFGQGCLMARRLVEVYYNHRLGNKLPFEQVRPAATIEKMVRSELKKEAVLQRVYGVGITPAMVEAEVKRIDATTRAPEMLGEIKAALGNAPRASRARWRDRSSSSGNRGRALPTTTRRTPRSAASGTGAREPIRPATGKRHARGHVAALAPARTGHARSAAGPPGNEKVFFADLDPQLQTVLRVQLQKPGDVSAVIETPASFLVFIAREKSAGTLSAASLSTPKRSYDAWLAQQPEAVP